MLMCKAPSLASFQQCCCTPVPAIYAVPLKMLRGAALEWRADEGLQNKKLDSPPMGCPMGMLSDGIICWLQARTSPASSTGDAEAAVQKSHSLHLMVRQLSYTMRVGSLPKYRGKVLQSTSKYYRVLQGAVMSCPCSVIGLKSESWLYATLSSAPAVICIPLFPI